MRDLNDLILIMSSKKVGDEIPVWSVRNGKPFQVEAVLKPRPK